MRAYIVTKDILNIRSSASDVSDENYLGFLKSGESIFLLDEEIVGTIPKGGTSDIWLRDSFNRFVSAEGVRLRNYEDKKTDFLKNTAYKYLHNGSSDENNWNVCWGFVDLEIAQLWDKYQTKGKGLLVAVLDSGLNYNLPCFQGKEISYYNALKDSSLQADCMDTVGHGSDVAALLSGGSPYFGVLPECALLVVKVTNEQGELSIKSLPQAIKKSADMGARVISISYDYPQEDANHSKIHDAVRYAVSAGCIVCVSCGNYGQIPFPIPVWPAGFEECLSVGATTKENLRWDESTKGPFVKIVAPGGPFAAAFNRDEMISGTSYSTPIVAGCIGILLSVAVKKGIALTPLKALKLLEVTADKKAPGYNTEEYGWGKVDIHEAIRKMLNP